MGAAAMGVQAAGAGLSAYGSYQQGLAQQNYYRYVAGNARTAAGMALQEGDRESGAAQDEGLLKSKALDRSVKQTEGAQAAAEGANGIAGSVTAADIATDTAQKANLDQMLIRYNANRTSWAAKNNAAMKAWQLNNEAAQDEVAGEAAKQSGKLGAFNSLLGGAGQVANTWYRNKQASPS